MVERGHEVTGERSAASGAATPCGYAAESGDHVYFMIRAADEVPNWSGFSNIAVRATSGDATAPGTIADLSVTGTTATSVSVRWTAPGDDGTTGTATSYDVRYSTSTITSSNWASATQANGEPTPGAAGTVTNFTVGGLTGSRTYYVAVRTTDEVGNLSAISNVVNGTTLDNVPPAPVRDLSYGEPMPIGDMLIVPASAEPMNRRHSDMPRAGGSGARF